VDSRLRPGWSVLQLIKTSILVNLDKQAFRSDRLDAKIHGKSTGDELKTINFAPFDNSSKHI
jgi:hypothetical protein